MIDFFQDLGINDMRLTSPILSDHLTARPENKLTSETVATIFEIQKMCSRTRGYPGVFAYDYFESKCPSYDTKRLPEFYRRMGFPVNKG